jgi:hypothetical protein
MFATASSSLTWAESLNMGGVTNAVGVTDTSGVTNMAGYSYQNRVVILSEARSAESKDLRLSSSHRSTC